MNPNEQKLIEEIRSMFPDEQSLRAIFEIKRRDYVNNINGGIDTVLNDARKITEALTPQDYTEYNNLFVNLANEDPLGVRLKEKVGTELAAIVLFLYASLDSQEYALSALSADKDALRSFNHIIIDKAWELFESLSHKTMPKEDEPKRRPRTTKAERLALIASDDLSKRLINYPYLNIPTSPAVESVLHLMNTGGNLSRLEERRPQICHGQTIRTLVKTDGGHEVRVITTTGVSTVTLEIKALDKLLHSPTARKMFIYTLKKLNDQAFSGGEFKQNYAVFTLQELIDIGYYSTEQSARKGFKNAMEVLTSIKVSGELHKGKKNVVSSEHLTVLYTGYELLGNGTYAFYVNERVNWAMVCAFYTSLPRFYFELSARASTLLYFIAVQARRETKTIAERRYLTISMRAVQERLNLPDEKGCNKPDRDIKQPVKEAIAEINQHAASNGIGLSLELIGSTSRAISDFLENAYIKATLSGEYAESFTTIASSQQKQIETAEKRREALTQKIIAERAAKKIDAAADQSAGAPPKRKRGRPPKNK